MRRSIFTSLILALTFSLQASNKGLQLGIERSLREHKAVYIIVTSNKSTSEDVDNAEKLIDELKSIKQNINVFHLNKDDEQYKEFVDAWQLYFAPTPYIIAISPNGNYMGGLEVAKTNPNELQTLYPSPKYDDIYSATLSHKAVYVVVANKNALDRQKVVNNCNEAAKALNGSAVVIEVDYADKKEDVLLRHVKEQARVGATTTLIINFDGEISEILKGQVSVKRLVRSAHREMRKGCSHGCCGHHH